MGDQKFVIALVALLAIYIVYELNKPQPEDWSITFYHQSTQPFGAQAVEELMTPLFNDGIEHVFKSAYELSVEDSLNANTLIIANNIELDKEDTDILLNQVAIGKTIFISAFSYGGAIADTFGLKTEFEEFLGIMPPNKIEEALGGESTKKISFNHDGKAFEIDYPELGATHSFDWVNSDSLEILAVNDEERPVLIRYQNNGQLILSTIPLAFTNYFTLLEETTQFTEAQLLLIPQNQPLVRNQYYQLGRMETGTPLRVLLSNTSLRWATYVLLMGILLFFVFQSKRQQRIIPIITPLANLTLEFVQILGRLYYKQSNHNNLSHKRVLYWKDFVRTHYNLNTQDLNQDFINELSRKSGKNETMVSALVSLVNIIEDRKAISDSVLLKFEKNLNEFYGIE